MAESFLIFSEPRQTPGHKTFVVDVCSKRSGELLGTIRWWGPWRQYTFMPERNTVWNVGCIEDVSERINELMTARKASP